MSETYFRAKLRLDPGASGRIEGFVEFTRLLFSDGFLVADWNDGTGVWGRTVEKGQYVGSELKGMDGVEGVPLLAQTDDLNIDGQLFYRARPLLTHIAPDGTRRELMTGTFDFPASDDSTEVNLIEFLETVGVAAGSLPGQAPPNSVGWLELDASGTGGVGKFLAIAADGTLSAAVPADSPAAVDWDDIGGKPATFPPTIGAGATQAVAGNDARLTNQRTPSDNSVTNAKMADDAVGIDELSASGTASASTFLRGDNTWATPAGSGDVSGQASSVDSEVALFSGTGGKTIKRATGTGIAKLTSGVLSAVNLGVADFAGSAVVTASETIAANNNDTTIPTSAAVKAYADSVSGGATAPYVSVLGAVTADVAFNITHGLNSNDVELFVKRSHSMSAGLTGLNRGERLWMPKAWPLDPNTLRVELAVSANANELIATVKDRGSGGDTTNPTVGTASSPTQSITTIDLVMTGATDNVAVAGVEWERSISSVWTVVGTVAAGNTFQDTGLPTNTGQSYRARVFDLQGRYSAYSNTITPSTTVPADVALDAVGAGNRNTGSATISTTQQVNNGAGKDIVVFLNLSHTAWFGGGTNDAPAWESLTITSDKGTDGVTPATFTKKQTQAMTTSANQGNSLLYELKNPANGTHTITVTGMPAGVGTPSQIIIFSASYHNTSGLTDITSAMVNATTPFSQNIPAGLGDRAIAFVASQAALAGFSGTLRDSDGAAVAGAADFALFGDAPGEADNSVNLACSSNADWHLYIRARLAKL